MFYKVVDIYNFWLQIVDLSKIHVVLLTNVVDVEFWQNFDVECRQNAGKIEDLHFVRPPPCLSVGL